MGLWQWLGVGHIPKLKDLDLFRLPASHRHSRRLLDRIWEQKSMTGQKKGALFGTICGIGIAEVIGIAVFFFSPYLIAAFGGDQKAIEYGIAEAHTIALFYCLLAFSHCMAAIQRGAGRSIVPMFVMMLVWCGVRVTYISIVIRIIPMINVIYWAYPLTWFISSVIFLILFLKTDWIHGLEKQ